MDDVAYWLEGVACIPGLILAVTSIVTCLLWDWRRRTRSRAWLNAELKEAEADSLEGQQTLRAYAAMSIDRFWEQNVNFRFKSNTLTSSLAEPDDTGKTMWELAGSAMTEESWVLHKADLATMSPFRNFSWERLDKGGSRRIWTVNGDPVFDRNGLFRGYRGTSRDITVEVKGKVRRLAQANAEIEARVRLAQANDELELGREQFNAVLNNISLGVCFFDSEKRLLLWNRRYAEIYKLPFEAMAVGRSLEEIVSDRHQAGSTPSVSPSDYLAWRDRVQTAKQPNSSVVSLKNGQAIAVYHQPMPGGGWVATHEDITQRQQAEASIAFMAHHDALTKLPNRVLFRERMEQAIAMAGRGATFAVICLDLDNFKQVNDTLGHPIGDGLLVAVSERLQACVRDGDTVARLGGDEFAIIQLALRWPDDAEVLASRIVTAFGQPFDIGGHRVMSGISLGVTIAPGDSVSYETLMRDADIALYLSKTEGRGTVRFFKPAMDKRIHERRMLELDLQGAVDRNEFELYYQPQINLEANRICGFEALLRWHHPTRGFVSPLDFIPVAEETGEIIAIGAWILKAACVEAQNWPSDIGVAVNISTVQFRKGDLVATVEAALAASRLRPDRLELEITESVLLRDTVDTLSALHRLRAMGICVALDDFGTGYSSLSYLRSFPFDKIKIDQSFVRDLMTNRESMSIVRAVTGLGQSLGMKTTAEGVETHEQLEKLREEGCTEVQGYLFSRPRPVGDLPLLIEQLQNIGNIAIA